MPLNIDIPSWNSKRILGIIYMTHSIFDFHLRNTSYSLSFCTPHPVPFEKSVRQWGTCCNNKKRHIPALKGFIFQGRLNS